MTNNNYTTINLLKMALDGTWARHSAISNNISNVNTPGYKRLTVSFEQQLKKAIDNKNVTLKTTNKYHIDSRTSLENFSPIIDVQKNYSTRRDKNNINIDVENAELAKNTIMYDALIRQVTSEFNKMEMVISEGGK